MKTLIQFARSRLFLMPLFLTFGVLHAVTFTNNTAIGFGDTNYDGLDLALSNCTVTVDGPHTFSSLLVGGGGILTHSSSANGMVSNLLDVLNEADVLVSTNPVTLQESNVLDATVVVTDLTGTNFYTNNVDYVLSSTNAIWTQIQRTTNSTIPSGATVLVSYESLSWTSAGLNLTISGSVQVLAGGMIQANGIGYTGGAGPGAGGSAGSPLAGAGGTYAGLGGPSSSGGFVGGTYGSFYTPTNLGSGGGQSYTGPGAAGGGLVNIAAGGSIVINGSVTANGANAMNSRAGAGSGGSVWLSGAALSGSGIISANGGSGDPPHGGGGGGGRVSLVFSTSSFTGPVSAYGGAGATVGGAGTVYTQFGGSAMLVLDNGGQPGATTPLSVANSSLSVVIQGQAVARPANAWTVENLTISSNGTLLAGSLTTLSVTSSGLLMVAPGGGILANGAGYPEGQGAGAGGTFYTSCGGGGYGGNGGAGLTNLNTGGVANGSQVSPSGFGSGGGYLDGTSPGGSGGGNIQLISVGGWVEVDGIVAANGLNGGGTGGGGSGGTVTITGGSLLGSGTISANGGSGAGAQGGGGGGGRILLNSSNYQFLGAVTAYGGGGANWGGAGTILIQGVSQNPQLILDNGGNLGTNTPLQSAAGTDLTIRNGAIGTSSSSGTLSLANLYINSNGWLTPLYTSQGPAYALSFSMSGNATIQAGGGVIADLAGYAAGSGNGGGHSYPTGSSNYCSGAGHGGYGGNSFGGLAAGGATYDSATAPSDPGSGGGTYTGSVGGAGGGVIRLSVSGTLEVDGLISANAGNGGGFAGGGGSGGAIWLSATTLSGAGSISANGGNGVGTLGGGGGGGMIYITGNSNLFVGSLSASGGVGANAGGAGTQVTQFSGKNTQFMADNGGTAGAATPLPSAPSTDVTLRNGAVGSLPTTSISLGNVVINSNAWLAVSNSYAFLTINCSTLTIQAGGGIVADAFGQPAGDGVGAGRAYESSPNYPCSGAGHGGIGGACAGSAALGGGTYDSVTSPNIVGSGGGSFSSYSFGGAGGGGLGLTVGGLLELDGLISANGGNGSGLGGGGGSGGAIRISAATLAGSGTIRANGGAGVGNIGGGGGGGCIALLPNANLFTGTITAYGGAGANWGGAGTILIQGVSQNPQLILDNGGNLGTNTPLQSVPGTDLTIRNGAIGATLNSGTVSFANLYINSNGWLAPLYVSQGPAYSLSFSMSGNATIQAGGGVVADLAGYAAGTGTGPGRYYYSGTSNYCSGAGHGGYGGNSFGGFALGGGIYDSATAPIAPGSGGGIYTGSTGGAGGGVIRLSVSGTLKVDGLISANAGNGSGVGGGGGSGGSIWLSAGAFSGAGSVSANGGNGAGASGGGGAGGMIYISGSSNVFVGSLNASGGAGANSGGAGTLVTQFPGKNTQFVADNGGKPGSATPLPSSTLMDVTLRNGAVGSLPTSALNLGNLVINSNAWLAISNSTYGFSTLTCSTVTIQSGGGIVADAFGEPANQGTGPGRSSQVSPNYPCGGAGHGGLGGASASSAALGGNAYDSLASPSLVGSGGGGNSSYSFGGAGGGGLGLTVNGLLELDGLISANGGNGLGLGGGGGSGGAIRINAGTLAGGGTIRANGGAGAGSIGGGGGGGCIALLPNANLFAGSITAYGGAGAYTGGAGTIYISVGGQSPQIIVDNGGQTGAATPVQNASTAGLTLRNGAVGSLQSSSESFANLLIMSNAWLMPTVAISLTINGNATIASGGGIVAVPSVLTGIGVGHGFDGGNNPCSGGGFGGVGAGITNGSVLGGTAYGFITAPTTSGSQGGSFASSIGGLGGGNIHLSVTGTLDVSGTLSANGGNGSGPGGGGGSGGGIYLSAGIFTGTGSITVNGGNGVAGQGGGGGGGRISIGYNLSSYTGAISAYGGGGAFVGGAGTIYTKATSQATGQVFVDNGGDEGTNTPISLALGPPPQPFNLVVRNGGIVSPQNSTTIFPQLANLTIASNGYLVGISGPATLDLLIWSNAVIETGGFINADGLGYALETGPGAGIFDGGYGSGAGYGGPGGASASANGGLTYGSSLQPTDFGSGGGEGEGPLAGGSAGGGAIRLNVGGALTVNGQLSAEGQAGVQDESGGGSGGSVWVQAAILSGTGPVAADGGSGQLYYGGGGGGGRVALYALANAYTGQSSARGGLGDHGGGNGTIVISNTVPALQVTSSPSGLVGNAVSQVDLYFNDPPNPNTMNAGFFALATPYGALPSNSISLAMVSYEHYTVTFPAQTAVGTYAVSLSTNVTDLYGRPLSATNAGSFTISLPVVQGAITDTNGHPVPGVLLQATGLSPTSTDVNGNYALGFVPGSSFTVTPSLGSLVFLPPSTTYTNPTVSISNQNYLAVSTLAPVLGASATATNLTLVWRALPGVTYQLLASSNLVTWLPYGPAWTGTNSLQVVIPAGLNPWMFYRISASAY